MDYLLDPGVTFLNHGSYGACPAPVFARYQELQHELERQPVEFLARRFHDLTGEARSALAAFVGARTDDLVFVPNATAGLNAVIRSLHLEPGDEVVTTRHEYGAVTRTWEFAGATLVYAEPDAVAAAIGPRTRAVSVSHITSPTALVLPVEEICAAARAAGVLAIVDGAHAPGQVPLDLEAIGADVYAGNCHKWLSAPKGAAFLWARPEQQEWIEPLVVSWGYDEGFVRRHGWQGTRDPAAVLAVPAAIEAHAQLDLERCRRIAASFHDRLPPVGETPAPQMWASEVATDDPDGLQRRLYDEHRIEVVVRAWEGRSLLRVSIAPYNDETDVERLLDALATLV
ncbi:MAG: aminotransferase class V-fold PLP-dependent enzyme [Actinomycetota bacterium]|nr:aminotransferase class V-fold PLP-dependent enzyme [Actinomycetota bacterium]